MKLITQAKNVLNNNDISFVEKDGVFSFPSLSIFYNAVHLLSETKFMLLIQRHTFKVKKDMY